MSIELAFFISMAFLLFLCIKLKLNAFVTLLLTALLMGILAGMPATDVVQGIVSGFAKTVESIGIVIIFGVMLGNYLEASSAANRIALDTVKLVGERNVSLAMAITGYIVSIPVFSDSGFVILIPIVKKIARKCKIPLAVLAVSLLGGLWATHVYVPPTPGPLAAAGLLGIDVGRAILYGSFASIFMTAGGWCFAELYLRKKGKDFFKFQDERSYYVETASEEMDEDTGENDDLPTLFSSLLPLLIPLVLILLETTCNMLLPEESPILSLTQFLGDANVALALGCFAAIALFYKRLGSVAVMNTINKSMQEAGPIVFITAAGGALGQILKASGAGANLAEMVINTRMPFILVPFVIAAILKIVQGSGTVAVVTAATLSAPIAATLGMDPILIFLASGAGARTFCHLNDSMFWIYSNYTGYDVETTLKTMTFSSIFLALGGLVATFIVSLWL